MRQIILTGAAEKDLEHIAQYTLENFGKIQAEKYYFGLTKALETLATFPELGLDYSVIKPRLRRFIYQRHTIYFTSDGKNLKVYRILGQKQGPLRQLSEQKDAERK